MPCDYSPVSLLPILGHCFCTNMPYFIASTLPCISAHNSHISISQLNQFLSIIVRIVIFSTINLCSEIKMCFGTTHTMLQLQSFPSWFIKISFALSRPQLSVFRTKMDLKWTFQVYLKWAKCTETDKTDFSSSKTLKLFLLSYFLSPSTPPSYSIQRNLYHPLPSVSEEIECVSSFSELNSYISFILITYMTLCKIFSFLNVQPSHL